MPVDALTARESAWALAASLLAAALLLFDALFLGRSTLAFPLGDPRADVRPWVATAAPGAALPDVNLATPDIVGFVLPGLVRARELRAAGGRGAWDDGQLLGFPFAAEQQFPVPSWIDRFAGLFDPVQALDVLLALHLAAALWLAFRAARLLGAAPPFAAVAAVGFALNAWMTTRWHCPPMTWASSWFPLQLSAVAWLRAGRRSRAVFEFGLGTGLGLASGFPQAPLLLGVAAVAFALCARAAWRPRALGSLALGGLAGVAVALPGLAGALSLDGDSLRARPESRAALASSHVPPAALAALILPGFFGDPVEFGRPDPPAATMEDWLPQRRWLSGQLQGNVAEVAGYVGLLLLLTLPAALGGRAGSDARRLALVALGALAASIGAASVLGASPVLQRLAFSNPKRFLCAWCCLLPFAAALAAQALAARRTRMPWTAAGALLSALLLVPALAARLGDAQAGAFADALWREVPGQAAVLLASLAALGLARRGGAAAWLPALVLVLDLGGQARRFNPTVPEAPWLPATRTVGALQGLAASSTRAEGRVPQGRVAVLGTAPNLLPPTLASAAGLRMLHGVTAMVPTRTADLLACLEGPLFDPADPRVGRGFAQPASLTHPLLDLLSVVAVVHADPGLAARTGLPVLFEAPEEGLGGLLRPTAGPLAFVCGGAQVIADRDERLAWLARRDAPVFETAIVERPPPVDLPGQGARGTVEAIRAGPESITLRWETATPGVLVVSEAWDPGWSLTIDGRAAEVLVVDQALMGAFVEAGRHEAVLAYATPGGGAARMAARVGLLVLAVAGLLAAFRRAGQDPDRPFPAAGPPAGAGPAERG